MDEGHTQAPPLLSESDLIGLMDQKGIGTDATIAEHIQKIQQRKVLVVRVMEWRNANRCAITGKTSRERCCRTSTYRINVAKGSK